MSSLHSDASEIHACDRHVENCITVCIRCAAACFHCSYVTELALPQDDKGRTLRLDKLCAAAVCRLLASLLAGRQFWHQDVCDLYAQLGAACEAENQQSDEAHAQLLCQSLRTIP